MQYHPQQPQPYYFPMHYPVAPPKPDRRQEHKHAALVLIGLALACEVGGIFITFTGHRCWACWLGSVGCC